MNNLSGFKLRARPKSNVRHRTSTATDMEIGHDVLQLLLVANRLRLTVRPRSSRVADTMRLRGAHLSQDPMAGVARFQIVADKPDLEAKQSGVTET